jgi:ribose transport system permease protein
MMTTTLSPEHSTGANAKLAQASSRRSLLKSLTEPLSLLGALIVLVIIFSVLNPRFASLENLQNLLNQASLPLIIGIGATFVILIGSIDLSVEGVMAATGVTFVLMSANSRGGADLGIWAWLVPLALGSALGLASGLLYTKARIPSFLVTLGMWFVGLGIATVLYGTDAYPELSNDALTVWPATITLGLPNVFWVALILMIIAALALRYTRFGRATLAIGNNEDIARSGGMPVTKHKIVIFIVAGVLSGLAGILAVMQMGGTSNNIGDGYLFITIPAVVIGGTALSGGKGGMLRTLLGIMLLMVLKNGLILAGVSPNFEEMVSGAILVIAIIAVAWSQRGRLRIEK